MAASITLFLTIVFSLFFGILAGYAAIWAIVRAFGGHTRRERQPARAAVQAGD